MPVGFDKRSRELTIDGQSIPGHTIWCNGLVGHMKIISPRHASVRHSGTKMIWRRGSSGSRGVGVGRVRGNVPMASMPVTSVSMTSRSRVRRVYNGLGREWIRAVCVATWEAIDWEMRAVDRTPLGVSALLNVRQSRDELVSALGDPAWPIVRVFCWTTVWKRSGRPRRRVEFTVRRCARPNKWKRLVVVRIVVRPAMSMRVGSGPCGRVFCDCSSHNITGGRGAKLGRCNCGIHRRNGCRCGKVRTVGDHGVAINRWDKYNGWALALRTTTKETSDCIGKKLAWSIDFFRDNAIYK